MGPGTALQSARADPAGHAPPSPTYRNIPAGLGRKSLGFSSVSSQNLVSDGSTTSIHPSFQLRSSTNTVTAATRQRL